MCPDKFIQDNVVDTFAICNNVVAPSVLVSVVIVTLPSEVDDRRWNVSNAVK